MAFGFSNLNSTDGVIQLPIVGQETTYRPTSKLASSSRFASEGIQCILRDGNNNPVVKLAIPASTFSLCVFGNLMAIAYLWRRKASRQKQSIPFYTLLMTLTWCDLIGCIVTTPVTFATYISGKCVIELGGQALCSYSGFAMIFFMIASITIVFIMSLERFIAIRFTLFYKSCVTKRKILSILFSLFILLVLVSALPFIGFGEVTQQMPGSWCFLNWRSRKPQHQIYNFLVVLVETIVIAGTILCNLLAVAHVIDSRRRLLSKGRRKHEIEMMVMMGIMTLVLALCNLPLLLRILVNQVSSLCLGAEANYGLTNWDLFVVRMATVNPIVDPWVYILCRRSVFCKIYRIFKRVLTCRCQKDGAREIFVMCSDSGRPTTLIRRRITSQTQTMQCRTGGRQTDAI